MLVTSTGARRKSVRNGFAHLTDSDLWEQRAQAAEPGGLGPWQAQNTPGTGLLTCMAKRYCSSFGPNLTELAGSLLLVLQGRKTGQGKAGEALPTHGTLGLPLCPTSLWQRECGLCIQTMGAPCLPETWSIWQNSPGQDQLLSVPVESVPPQTLLPSLHLPPPAPRLPIPDQPHPALRHRQHERLVTWV